MSPDFGKPQRQSPIGILMMFLDTFKEYLRAFWPLLVIWIIRLDTLDKLMFFGGLAVFLLFLGFAAYLRYRNFTFYIDETEDEFIVTQGIFSKTRTAIKLDRIQQVNINQSVVQRIIGVHELAVDTAGSSDKEAKIRAISHPLATALKTRLLEESRRAQQEVASENVVREETPQEFIKISFASLVKTGITSNYVRTIGVMIAFSITILDNIRRWGETTPEYDVGQYVDTATMMQSAATVVLLFVAALLVINLVRTVFQFFGYTINRQNSSLLLTFGLLSTRNTIIRPERVQITSVIQNYFQRKMNILRFRIRQAGGEADVSKSAIEIPGCQDSERDEILKLLYGIVPEYGVMLRPNIRKLVFAVFLSIVLPLSVFFLISGSLGGIRENEYIPLAYVVFVGLILWFGYRNNRMYLTDRFIIIRRGAWDVTTEILESKKIQAITTSQLFWHKSLNIGTVKIYTAGGMVSFSLGNFAIIQGYVNRWLYQIESSNENWM